MAYQGLDEEFKHIITKMKPHAKRLPHQSEERSKVTVWIKKLLAVREEKSERNEYARLLLQALKSGKLDPPFSSDPPQGSLPRLNISQPLTTTSARPFFTPQSSHTQSLSGAARTWYPLETSTHFRDERQTKTKGRKHVKQKQSGGRGQKQKLRSQSAEHERMEPAGVKQSPLYFKQTDTPSGVGSYGEGSSVGRRVYTSGDGLWSMEARAVSTERPQQTFQQDGSRSPPLFNRSAELEELLPSSPSVSLSDDVLGSDDSQLSDVSELLMGQSEYWTRSPKVPDTTDTRESFVASGKYSPQKAFAFKSSHGTSCLLQAASSGEQDITREILQSREFELKIKAAENRFDEEKLKIQKTHEESLKQILDRKNNELEELRTESRLKESQLSCQVRRLEMKFSQSLKENKALREEGNQSLVDSRQYRQKLEAHFEEKLHSVVSEFEQSKLELEEHHAKAHTRLIQEMSSRVAAITSDHSAQKKADADVVSSLKAKLKEMSRHSENLAQAHFALEQEKVRLEEKCASLETELSTAVDRVASLEECLRELGEDKERQLRELRARTEQSVLSVQKEYSIQESKMCEAISELKQQVGEMERETEKVRQEHSLKLTEMESERQRLLRQKDLGYEKKVIELKRDFSEREFQAKQRETRLEEEVQARAVQLEQMKATVEQQSKQAERAIDEFKTEVERQTIGMFDQMRGELARLEQELSACRAEKEAEKEQLTKERSQDMSRMEGEREETELRHKEEIEELVSSHKHDKAVQREELERTKEEMCAKLSSELTQLEAQATAKESHAKKVIASLEEEVRGLKEQLEVQICQHNHELEEREQRTREEVEAAVRIHEAAIGKLKSQLESHKSKQKEEHKRQVATLLDKHDHKLRQLEHRHSHESSQLTETINSLKDQVQFLEETLKKQQSSHEEDVREMMRKSEEEVTSLRHHQESIRKSLQQEAEAAHLTIAQHQERNKHQLAKHNSELSHLKLFYEETLRGMLPATMKLDYEDTIKSLRTQISLLQQRAGVLQEELDQRYSAHRSSPNRPNS